MRAFVVALLLAGFCACGILVGSTSGYGGPFWCTTNRDGAAFCNSFDDTDAETPWVSPPLPSELVQSTDPPASRPHYFAPKGGSSLQKGLTQTGSMVPITCDLDFRVHAITSELVVFQLLLGTPGTRIEVALGSPDAKSVTPLVRFVSMSPSAASTTSKFTFARDVWARLHVIFRENFDGGFGFLVDASVNDAHFTLNIDPMAMNPVPMPAATLAVGLIAGSGAVDFDNVKCSTTAQP